LLLHFLKRVQLGPANTRGHSREAPSREARNVAFCEACFEGDMKVVQRFLYSGWVNIDATDGASSMNTALSEAACNGQNDVVELLLQVSE
jgi:hypothetical protein